MARDRRANIGTGLWFETSIRGLTRRQQQAYFLAYTQPDVSRCGVVPYRLRSWTGLAIDGIETELHQDYQYLHTSRHVVLDVIDEQLLIRTYVKHDGLLNQPLVVASMIRDYHRITSPMIRVAFLAEIRRLWDDPDLTAAEHRGLELVIGANPADVGINGAAKVASAIGSGLLGQLIDAIGDSQVEPYPAKGLPKGLTEGQREGLTKGLGNPPLDPRNNARAPVPAPVPATATAPAPAARDEPPDDPTSQLLTEHANAYGTPPPPSALQPVRTQIARLIAEHVPPTDIRNALTRMRDRNVGAALLPQLVVEARNSNNTRPSTTDQRVQAARDIAADLRAQGM